jgi:hypothetical protein
MLGETFLFWPFFSTRFQRALDLGLPGQTDIQTRRQKPRLTCLDFFYCGEMASSCGHQIAARMKCNRTINATTLHILCSSICALLAVFGATHSVQVLGVRFAMIV